MSRFLSFQKVLSCIGALKRINTWYNSRLMVVESSVIDNYAKDGGPEVV